MTQEAAEGCSTGCERGSVRQPTTHCTNLRRTTLDSNSAGRQRRLSQDISLVVLRVCLTADDFIVFIPRCLRVDHPRKSPSSASSAQRLATRHLQCLFRRASGGKPVALHLFFTFSYCVSLRTSDILDGVMFALLVVQGEHSKSSAKSFLTVNIRIHRNI